MWWFGSAPSECERVTVGCVQCGGMKRGCDGLGRTEEGEDPPSGPTRLNRLGNLGQK
jgi:hypothetical protein